MARWFVARNKKKHGPFTWKQLQTLARQGKLRGSDKLLAEGQRHWVEASTVPDLFPSAAPPPRTAPPRKRRRWLAGVVVVALCALAVGGYLAFRPPPAVKDVEVAVAPKAVPAPETLQTPLAVAEEPAAAPAARTPPQPTVSAPTPEDRAADFLQRLNGQRQLAGVAAVAIDAELSRGCAAHARYLARNLGELSDAEVQDEDPARPEFSDEGRRAAAASVVVLSEPRAALAKLLGRLNSRVPLLNAELQAVGLGLVQGKEDAWICVVDLTRGRGEPVVVYPGAGQLDVPLTFSGGNEVPDPEASAGFPVTVTFPAQVKVGAVSAALHDEAGKEVDAWVSTPEAPARKQSQRNSVSIIARAPLASRHTYEARVTAQLDGKPWSKTWRFTTEDDSDSSGAWARKALEKLNAYRAQAGQPAVALDPQLSRGCLAHARYLAVNAGHAATLGLGAHDEDPKLPGFSEEGRKAGKAADIAIGDFEPLDGLDAWMATLYHRVPLLEPNLQRIGFGCARGRRLGWIAVLDVGSGRVRAPRPSPIFYPVPDQRDVPLNFPSGGEEPNPIPDDKDGKAGYPITATFPERSPLREASATLTGPAGAVPCWFSSPQQPGNPEYPRHQGTNVCLIPHDPLAPGTTYRVELKGKLDGAAWQKSWQFKTVNEELTASQAAEQVVARLNEYRRRAGVPAVSLDAKLSRGCQLHAQYLVRNADTLRRTRASVNNEDPQLPGFTPEGQQASRQTDVLSNAPTPVGQVDDLMGTFFRRVYLLDPTLRRIGFGAALDVGRGWRCVLDLIGGRGDQRVVVYPAAGQADVPVASSDRLPEREDVAGFPITVTFPSGVPIRNVQAVLEEDAQSLDLVLSTPEAPLWPAAPRSTIGVYPRRPLAPGKEYRVTVSAIVSGREWRQTWSFTTAASGGR